MKTTIVAAIALLSAFQAQAQDNHSSFFANDPFLKSSTQTLSPIGDTPLAMSTSRLAGRAERGASGGLTGSTSLIDAAAQRHGVPVQIARAAVMVESKGRCNARGRAGELGPLQIKPATARGLGYTGPASALATCGAGLEWGMRHLALAYRKCGHVGPHNYGLAGGCARTAYVRKVMRFA